MVSHAKSVTLLGSPAHQPRSPIFYRATVGPKTAPASSIISRNRLSLSLPTRTEVSQTTSRWCSADMVCRPPHPMTVPLYPPEKPAYWCSSILPTVIIVLAAKSLGLMWIGTPLTVPISEQESGSWLSTSHSVSPDNSNNSAFESGLCSPNPTITPVTEALESQSESALRAV